MLKVSFRQRKLQLKFTSDLQANAEMICDRFEIKRFCSRDYKRKGHCEENRYNLYFYIQSLEFVLVYRRMLLNREPLFSESIMSSDEEGLDPQERLEKAQRKEKKELQAKIQALKNSIPKGDKKKKKEVTAEIARLESDLDQKHSAEMLDLLTDNMSLTEDQEEPTNNTNCDNDDKNEKKDDKNNEPRVSKAQKR